MFGEVKKTVLRTIRKYYFGTTFAHIGHFSGVPLVEVDIDMAWIFRTAVQTF